MTSAGNMAPALAAGGGVSPLVELLHQNRGQPPRAGAITKACVELETGFIQSLLQEMRRTFVGGLRSRKLWQDQYMSLCDQEVARNLAAAGGLGVARFILDQITPPGATKEVNYESAEPAAGEPRGLSVPGDFPVPGTPGSP